MLRYIVILFALTPCCWSSISQASRCNPDIINKMNKTFWNNVNPVGIIQTGKSWGKMPILRTTAGHYSDEDHINCAYVTYSDTSVDLVVKYETSSNLPDLRKTFVITEQDGELFDEENKEYRYYPTSGNDGVRCFHRCSETGNTGPPDGVIEVSEHGYTKEALDQCIKNLESLDIKMSPKKFNDHCET